MPQTAAASRRGWHRCASRASMAEQRDARHAGNCVQCCQTRRLLPRSNRQRTCWSCSRCDGCARRPASTDRLRSPMDIAIRRSSALIAGIACWEHARRSNLQGAANSLVVVNAGTATTVDCVDADGDDAARTKFVGKFIGGVIAPGVRLMLESLAVHTAGLPSADADFSANVADFPDNTDAAIVTGVLDAQAGLVYRIWHRFAVHHVR